MKKGYLKKTLRQTAEIFTEELKNVFKDSGVIIIFFAAGLIYPILYSSIYKNEAYRNVAVAVVNEKPTCESRELVRRLDATPEINVKYTVNSIQEARKLFAENKVYGVILIPSEFSKDLAEGRQTQVFAYSTISSMMYYRTMYAGFNAVVMGMDKQIQLKNLKDLGLTDRQATVMAEPVLSEGHALYNPKAGFSSFLLPAILVLIIQQTLVLGIGLLAGTAREENTFHQLIPYQQKYHGTMRIISGKGLAYLVIYTFISVYNLLLVPYLFKLPHFLNLATIVPFLLPFLLACIFFGMAISVFFWNREMSLLLYLCLSVPLLFMSGFSWPGAHIPVFWRMISMFFPSTFGINAFVKMNSMGASLADVGPQIFAMWVQAGIYFVFAWFVYYWQIKLSERKIRRS
ncbi:MAG: ABC transporter permease [Bacteroidota bacterium]|nr:ABC transporter permease [Bacteroidota bacterium]